MAVKSGTLDHWRDYFRSSNSDIFDIIEHAIMVAASDCPMELKLRRDRIAEKLFSCHLARCLGCDGVELSAPEQDDDGVCKNGFDGDGCEFEPGGSKDSKVNSSRDDQGEMQMNQMSNYSYGEAEALTDEIEEENQTFGEVLRIKEIFDNSPDESDTMLFDSLRRLQLMDLSMDTLKATEIGKSVNALRKHETKQIRHLARMLIEVWKDMVDEWVNATTALAGTEGTPESANPSVVNEEEEEEGLPSPPLDEVAFIATQTTSIELSKFFDGMDDDGNPRTSGEFNKNCDIARKPSREYQNMPKRNEQVSSDMNIPFKVKGEQGRKEEAVMRKQASVIKQHKPSNTESSPGRLTKLNVEQKARAETKFQQKSDKATIQKKPQAAQQDKFKTLDDAAKLEAAKRKLHERYQQAENAKKQRTIQVMEIRDLPKQGLGHRNPHMRPGNHNRHWTNGRR